MSQLKEITIQGYKSIKNLEKFELNNLNILIGANGAGKSNFISAFKFLANIYEQNLQSYIPLSGGVESFLHYGRKNTDLILMKFLFNGNGYAFKLMPTQDNRLIFKEELLWFAGYHYPQETRTINIGGDESLLKDSSDSFAEYIRPAIKSWRVYHFHDTSDSSKLKQKCSKENNLVLLTDGYNIAPYLLKLKNNYSSSYKHIVKTIKLVAPFFGDFILRDDDMIELEWYESGNPDIPFKTHILSDGTLRFIALVTLLLQPFELMSDTIIIDEPELGLHPYAINILAGLIKRVSDEKQIIISTQSVELIDNFEPEDIIVTNKIDNASVFKRLDAKKLLNWLEDYSLGELWKQNIIGGRPSR